jgi:hypothetical protein
LFERKDANPAAVGFQNQREEKLTNRPGNKTLLVLVGLVAAGVLLRILHVVSRRSLWGDEAMIAENIMARGFGDLTQLLDYQQSAPIGWLFSQRVMWLLTDDPHIGLRLLPLVAGILALGLVAWFAYRHLTVVEALFVVTAMALLPTQIYYSGEVKQYINDVVATALIITMVWPRLQPGAPPLTTRQALILGLVGLLLIPLSQPAAFILGGAGAALGLDALARRDWRTIGRVAVAAVAWLGLFAVLYLTIYGRDAELVEAMRGYWNDRFAPIPPTSPRELLWYYNAPIELAKAGFFYGRFFQDSFNTANVLAAFLMVLGFIRLAVEAWPRALLFVVPILAALLASAVELYPFSGRFLLFAAPLVMIATAFGITWLVVRSTLPPVLLLAMPVLILLVPLSLTLFEFGTTRLQPFNAPDSLGAIEEAAARYREGDVLYVAGIGDFRVMRERLGLAEAPVQMLRGGSTAHQMADIERLNRYRRALVIYANDPLANRRIQRNDAARLERLLWSLDQAGAETIDIKAFREAYLLDVTFRSEAASAPRRFPEPEESHAPVHPAGILRDDESLPD